MTDGKWAVFVPQPRTWQSTYLSCRNLLVFPFVHSDEELAGGFQAAICWRLGGRSDKLFDAEAPGALTQ